MSGEGTKLEADLNLLRIASENTRIHREIVEDLLNALNASIVVPTNGTNAKFLKGECQNMLLGIQDLQVAIWGDMAKTVLKLCSVAESQVQAIQAASTKDPPSQ